MSIRKKAGSETRVTRRDLIRFAGTGALMVGVSGCQVVTSGGGGGGGGKPTSSAGSAFVIPHTGAKLPKGDVTIKWMSGGPGSKTPFFKAWFPAYHKAHPNITVQYDELPNDKVAEVLPLQLQSGTADDVFYGLGGVSLGQAALAGQVAALDDIIPNFKKWVDGFPFGVLVPGITQFQGKTWGLPFDSGRRCGTLLLYNTPYLHQAGRDPASQPLTVDEFRTVARKVTQRGNGQYYGFAASGKPGSSLTGIVGDLGQLAGAPGGGLNWKSGHYEYDHPAIIATIELLVAMQKDGSLLPGTLSLSQEQARAHMPQGSVAMMLQGPWNFPIWKQENPSLRIGVARQPTPNGKLTSYLTYAVGGQDIFAVSSKVPASHKAIAGDLLYYIGTESGQQTYTIIGGSGVPAWNAQAASAAQHYRKMDPHDRTAYGLYDELMRLAPSPLIRNPDNGAVQQFMVPVHPDLGEVTLGVLTGQVSNVKAALQDLNARSEKALDDAIAKARSQGAAASRDDWRFPNWDPNKDYTQSSYRSLPKQ